MAELATIKIEPSDELIKLVEQMKEVCETFEGVRVQVLKPTPGSTIVLACNTPISESGRDSIKKEAEACWPGCKVLVLDDGLSLVGIEEKE